MKKSRLIIIICILAAMPLLQNCGTTSRGVLFAEKSIKTNDIVLGTVAILPNRLPMNLTNADKWKQFNFGIIQRNFQERGYRVIDYSTADQLFTKSGLPLEDTKISRDKYADLADELNADILIFPYYGQLFSMSGCMIASKFSYSSIGTLQFYAKGKNDFFTRVDYEGTNYYNSIIQMIPVFGLVYQAVVSADSRFEKASEEGINKAIKQFFERYSFAQNNNNNNNNNVKETNVYDKYSLKELEKMKQDAVEAKDFQKAADLKKEIDRRKK